MADGQQKVYDLWRMIVNTKKINIKTNKPEFYLKEKSDNLKKALDSILSDNGSYVFLGIYPNLPNSFSGNDIDILVSDIKLAKRIFRDHGFVIRQQYKSELRVFMYVVSVEKWMAIDIETIASYSSAEKKILEYMLRNPHKNNKTGLLHSPVGGMLAYKIMKYIANGYVHSWYQIQDLNESWDKSDKNDKKMALSLLDGFSLNKRIMRLITSINKIDIADNIYFQEYIDNKRNERHARRLIYQGRINAKSLLMKPLLLWLLFYRRFYKSKNALPAIALVGNDGSGKTEQSQRLINELYKLDPIHIVMRGNEFWLPGWGKCRNFILFYLRKKKKEKIKSSGLIEWILAWIGEIGDFLDKWFRYQIGMAWANAGFGFVIFERYPTDRLRGEYPGPKWSLFPIEQYFPMPDIIALLDVNEDDSLKRKPNDGHSYQEMHEKRENYLRLIKEIKPSIVISSKKSLDDIQRQLSKLIWDCSLVKQRGAQIYSKFPAKWSPKIDDKMPKRGKQKDGFL
jgi:hypothetical protein